MRRWKSVLWTFAAFCVAIVGDTSAKSQETAAPAQWYRGMIHMHSYWSDGQALPEEALALYKEGGCDFLVLSDHNRFQDNPDQWVEVGKKVKPEILAAFEARFGADAIERKKVTDDQGEKTLVRLKTFDELKALMEKDGDFLLIPGYEHSGDAKNGEHVHLNAIGTRRYVPLLQPETSEEMLKQNVEALDQMLATERADGGESLSFTMLNHPDWRYYDVLPEELIPYSTVRFFEIRNCGPTWKMKDGCWTCDTFWDVVNAYRALENAPLVYGVASDDTHGYGKMRENPQTGPGGWIVVKAPELTQTAILQAMNDGNFYASTGVVLDDVTYDPQTKTNTLTITPRVGETLTVRIFATSKTFDQTKETVEIAADGDQPARTLFTYSDEIGREAGTVVVTVEENQSRCDANTTGMEKLHTFLKDGTCTITWRGLPDDLYTRAMIESGEPQPVKHGGKPDRQTAWTQPRPAM